MDLLGESDSSEDEEVAFKINTNYAQNYDKWRKKEERQKLIDKYGEDVDGSSSSSEEEEIRTSKQMDKDWLRAYAVVRFQQPRLYKEGEKFFHDEAKPLSSKKKDKATTLKDHERKFILEKGGIESDEESAPKPQGKSYFEEQEEIKKSFKDAVADSSDDDDDNDDSGFLVKKRKTEEDEEKDENDYLEWLRGEKEGLDDPQAEAELAPLKAYWNDPNLDEKETVLRDYILNNGYMAEESSESEDEEKGPDPEEEEKFLSQAEEYEHRYNFRHEEPGGDEIKAYPRVITESVRPKDTRRAEKRKRKMEKKTQAREQRHEEIRLLQKLQREEKEEKLLKLRQIGNNPDLDYDLEADFDPDEHNKIMEKYFNDGYYGDEGNNEKKPEFEFDAAIDDDPEDWWTQRSKEEKDEEVQNDVGEEEENGDYDNTQQNDEQGPDMDDPNFNMDADFDPTRDYKAEKKRAKKYGKAFAKKLPLFDPTTKTFDEYIDEYLKDKINTLPFTYREVVPNDFGLSTEEILKAPERELNAWVSVKKMSQYRSRQDEMADVRKFAARARDQDKKFKVLPSLLKKQEEIAKETSARNKKKKKKRKKKKVDEDGVEEEPSEVSEKNELFFTDISEVNGEVSNSADKSKKRKREEDENGSSQVVSKKRKSVDGAEIEGSQGTPEAKLKKKKSEKCVSMEPEPLSAEKKSKKKKKQDIVVTKSNDSNEGDGTDVFSVVVGTGDHDVQGKVKKKKKKTKTPGVQVVTGTADSTPKEEDSRSKTAVLQKKKKKKTSIRNFPKATTGASSKTEGGGSDPKQAKRKLGQVMSSSRLSSMGIGPGAAKNKRKKKKNKAKDVPS
ncbi:protein KRI1 homolog [Aplysia californica]|uniref:Protein KRI1 homolog n=1 Tax=Aplysia californica TaxID=6500 RepID=A0ABM0JU37_APLCA|nr:protein KRI1 homolog [Aplysia californica]